ncbi:putative SH3 domain-containing protein [Rosellinia necatrix]|uniref:Actin cytoskeleton-regulatory complex protein SLA1 n=1 Tax=Rosellinia necatrix TaxID=77044 RepID=A0A1W2TPK8_ROSNE|nr:putative SH3 domain-containing protein [Rosellinia necatrix]
MGFLGIYRAIYDYTPQSEGELSISEGDLLCVLEKSGDDDWWKAKKKASADEEDEPTGLVPNNYVEEAKPVGQARSLYEYTRQTDEELSFPEDAPLRVYDASDPDWILVGFESDFGFVPANYIEMSDGATRQESEPLASPAAVPATAPAIPLLPPALPPSLPPRPAAPVESDEPQSPPLPDRPRATASPTSPSGPEAILAGVMQGRPSTRAPTPPPIILPSRQPRPYVEEPEDKQSPDLPARPRSHSPVSSVQFVVSPPPPRTSSRRYSDDRDTRSQQFSPLAPGGFHMYNINEMVSVMGKKKKMPTTLGINLKTGVILIAPEKAQDGPTQEWTAEKMTHYSREGKHVFLELVRPSKSIDFHAGAKNTAEEIVSALGELSGAMKAEGLREVIAAGTGKPTQKRGQILYDFTAQGDDEVTVLIGDEVIILDDTKSDEWWQVRRVKNGKEGVVPSSYVERMEIIHTSAPTGINAGMSSVAQNRQDELRLTREAVKKDQKAVERNRRENGSAETGRSAPSRSKPDPSKVRVWTDRSKSFSVEAQFLGLKDGKINLHKMNGVKIAVPLAKMSMEDIEYVERATGISLDEDKPLADVKRAKSMRNNLNKGASSSHIGASVEPAKPSYDWFQFFLSCDVAVGLCERYTQAFVRDSMDESVLPDVDSGILRNLGLREGDIIKVMRYLDKKFDRDGKKKNAGDADGENGSAGGLFSGPGGTLRNNTRKGRPAPAVQTSDVVDAKVLSQSNDTETSQSALPPPDESHSKAVNKTSSGFEDNAWDIKPAKQSEAQPKPAPSPEPKAAPVQHQPAPTQAMQELSLLATPLEPTKKEPPASAPPQPQQTQGHIPSQPAQIAAHPQGATPSFFTGISAAPTGAGAPALPLNLGLGNRQRPTPPQVMSGQGALMPPPPARPLSAPQSAQSSGFAPPPIPALQPQITGIAPPGHSLNDLTQQRFQQSYMGNFQQPPGQGFMQLNPVTNMPQPTGFGAQQQFMAPQMTGAPQMQSPFSDPRAQQFTSIPAQPTGYPSNFQPQQFPHQTGVNAYLPQALEPQRTSIPAQPQMQPQQTGFGGFGAGFNAAGDGPPQAAPIAPLQPQKTGPAPPVRFGVTNKIAPQPTGRRANLAQATPQNPFGF